MAKERLQKLLAAAGMGSRRQIDQWIVDGEIRVNGEVATPGTRADADDRIEVRGQRVDLAPRPPRRKVLLYHKPEGELTTRHDPEGRPTVFEHLPAAREGRWITVGRLDLNTSGLLLVTNDGELANRLMHPSYEIERRYAVRVLGGLDEQQQAALLEGVMLEDGPARFVDLADAGGSGANHWYHVTLREGRNREVRRLIESQGVTVSRLIRIGYGGIALPPRLRPGRVEVLETEAANALAESVGLPPEAPAPTSADRHRQRRQDRPFRVRGRGGRRPTGKSRRD
ncbi:MAG: 23S rRNA pseudouridine(2605) synthase RluB [Halothiobacillaceae bacterium]